MTDGSLPSPNLCHPEVARRAFVVASDEHLDAGVDDLDVVLVPVDDVLDEVVGEVDVALLARLGAREEQLVAHLRADAVEVADAWKLKRIRNE